MKRFLAPLSAVALALFAFSAVATAHSGSVSASENCDSFVVHVYLHNNVTSDRTVNVTTTIPGTTGLTNQHYNTTGASGDTEILTLTGPAPASGSVTLTIKSGSTTEDTESASVSPASDCAPPPAPGIHLTKSNDAADTVEPGTKVTYTYLVENTGNVSLDDVVVKDQLKGSDNVACEPVAYQSGDTKGDKILDPGEIWTFTCSTDLQGTTTNQACVTANQVDNADAEAADDCDNNTVEVSHSPEQSVAESAAGSASAVQSVEAGTGTPAGSIPNTSIDGSGPSPLPTILFSLVLIGSLGGLAYTNVKVVARDKR